MNRRNLNRSRGFTLIELLVVIAIIGVLIGLLLPAVQNVRHSVRRTTTVSEISQIGTGISGFKSKFGTNSFIPSCRYEPDPAASPPGSKLRAQPFRLRNRYYDPSMSGPPAGAVFSNSYEAIYLRSLFQFLSPDSPNTVGGPNGFITGLPDTDLDPNQCLVFFLTGGPVTNYQGFSLNKQAPFTPAAQGETRIGPFLDLPASKYDGSGHLLDPYGNPYAYFAYDPGINTYPDGSLFSTNAGVSFTLNGTARPYLQGGKYLNQKGYQIISAGRNGGFGPGGNWVPGAGAYSGNGVGADDLSNFNGGELRAQQN